MGRQIRRLEPEALVDEQTSWDTVASEVLARGYCVQFVREDILAPGGERLRREWVRHPGAVAVVATDADDCVVMVRQYRHPTGFTLLEPPAGLLDVADEPYLAAAQRELAEETGLAARDWSVLVDTYTSPGGSGEATRIFHATGLSDSPRPDGFVSEGEEAYMDVVRAPIADVVAAILAGRLSNPALIAGVLALVASRASGQALRSADAPWPARAARNW